jgi:hypothetical protein
MANVFQAIKKNKNLIIILVAPLLVMLIPIFINTKVKIYSLEKK